MSDTTLAPTTRGPGRPPITAEQRAVFLKSLALTGSADAASAAASAAVETFRRLRHCDPLFDEQWDNALSQAQGRAESMLVDRMGTPDTRPVSDKQGNLIGQDVSWRSANALLLRFLERMDNKWVQKRQVDGSQTITVNHGTNATQRTGVLLTADDVKRLPPERMQLLLGLIDEVYALADAAKSQAALPAPEQPNV